MTDVDRSIDGVAKTTAEVLESKKYSIDYYQREYAWEAKQLAELVADLTTRFLEIYEPGHARKDVARYPSYFLGSIIISQKQSQPFIVDGQQRLTSLTLLLTYLHRLQQQQGGPDGVDIDQLIISKKFGAKSFNLEVPDREAAMTALFESGSYYPPNDASKSVHNLVARYEELDELFPDELKTEALPYFLDWLKDRVQLVQITAYTDDDAYAIFETMNDRGLRLTPLDMLKGYLLANMDEGDHRTEANSLWRQRMRALDELGEDSGSDFLKTWLRSQYATKIRERRKGAQPEDWDRIGTEFHRWLRGAHATIGLRTPGDYYGFVVRDLHFFSQQYERILTVPWTNLGSDSPLRFIRYNADLGFTLQYQLLLAPLQVGDDNVTIDAKLELVGRFIDILLAWRIWNFRANAYSTMQYRVFNVMRDIRGASVAQLAHVLHQYLRNQNETFDTNDELYLHQQNRSQLHKLLARITDYVTVESGGASRYAELTNAAGVRYEVEHIWSNHPERHRDEFPNKYDFARHRNRIGGLILLPKQFNASYGDDPYAEKLPHYFGQNLLAASLHPQCYEKNPRFVGFIRNTGLQFRAYEEFPSEAIIDRGELYREIAKLVWNPEDLLKVAKVVG